MIRSYIFAGLVVGFAVCLTSGTNQLLAMANPLLEQPPAVKTQQAAPVASASPDEVAIREVAKTFAKAFNAGDAKTVAAQWTEDGEYVNENGQRYQGRQAIQQEYEKFFAEYPGVQINIKVDLVKVLTPESAIEEGTATLGMPNAALPVSSRYLVVHVKQNGKWMIASSRDVSVGVFTEANAADLKGMLGTWHYQNGTTLVETKCRWIAGKKFLERKFSVSDNGKVTHSGTQIIGLDPMSQQITSWLFDSSGGHGVGIWTRQENGWTVESSGSLVDGTPTSALNQITHVDKDSIAWKSVNRTAGDQPLPDLGEVVLKRVTATNGGN